MPGSESFCSGGSTRVFGAQGLGGTGCSLLFPESLPTLNGRGNSSANQRVPPSRAWGCSGGRAERGLEKQQRSPLQGRGCWEIFF